MTAMGAINQSELPEVAAARAILFALKQVLEEDGKNEVTSEQIVNELLPGPGSLRSWFIYLIDEANSQDQEAISSKAIRDALELEEEDFKRGCNLALNIVG
ncbi:RNA polymerase subunit sigma-54 [Roseibium sp. HPY-6]|uniref:RNA polymerase subunit sigma-54 n=1 Tax=Roseibium sp. HPY-6 TaxID=3229852 RepID=UPI00338F1407